MHLRPRRLVLALAAALVMGAAPEVRATPAYARKERQSCLHCHTRKRGGQDFLNPTGVYYSSYRTLPIPGQTLHPKPAAGPSPQGAWDPAHEPARAGSGNSRTASSRERAKKAQMARWTRALGAKSCYTCHADRLRGATPQQIAESRHRYEVSMRHAEMTRWINRTMGGGEKVTCYTCHLGGRGPVTLPGGGVQ